MAAAQLLRWHRDMHDKDRTGTHAGQQAKGHGRAKAYQGAKLGGGGGTNVRVRKGPKKPLSPGPHQVVEREGEAWRAETLGRVVGGGGGRVTNVRVRQGPINALSPGLQQVGEPESQISKSYHQVAAHCRLHQPADKKQCFERRKDKTRPHLLVLLQQ